MTISTEEFEVAGVLHECGCGSPYGAIMVAPFVSENIRDPRPDWGEDEAGRSVWCADCWIDSWMET